MGRAASIIPFERIERRIFVVRGHRVMLSPHLAELDGVEPRSPVPAVKRNLDRFPNDFMVQLTPREFEKLKSQIVISSWGGLRRGTPLAFTEHGVAMLSSVRRSPKAVRVNISIIRVFIRLRRVASSQKELRRRLLRLDQNCRLRYREVVSVIQTLIEPPHTPRPRIGFRPNR
ncbi:MAG TPA: ORF6N domain-containing protein [Planctomycetota bacterium]|nr:ORF6N domain-containing protein [Planctomycetota bacterium]